MTYHITAQGTAIAAAAAYRAGRLGFQRPGLPTWAYRDGEFVNVFGAVLPDHISEAADDLSGRHIFRLREAGLVDFSDDDNPILQTLHQWFDFACEGVSLGEAAPETMFCTLVNSLLPDGADHIAPAFRT